MIMSTDQHTGDHSIAAAHDDTTPNAPGVLHQPISRKNFLRWGVLASSDLPSRPASPAGCFHMLQRQTRLRWTCPMPLVLRPTVRPGSSTDSTRTAPCRRMIFWYR